MKETEYNLPHREDEKQKVSEISSSSYKYLTEERSTLCDRPPSLLQSLPCPGTCQQISIAIMYPQPTSMVVH
jgi:hypothetical protein